MGHTSAVPASASASASASVWASLNGVDSSIGSAATVGDSVSEAIVMGLEMRT